MHFVFVEQIHHIRLHYHATCSVVLKQVEIPRSLVQMIVMSVMRCVFFLLFVLVFCLQCAITTNTNLVVERVRWW